MQAWRPASGTEGATATASTARGAVHSSRNRSARYSTRWKADAHCEYLLRGDKRAAAIPAREGHRGARGAGSARGFEVAFRAGGRAVGTVDGARGAVAPRGSGAPAPPAHLGRPRAD